mmetsp:Transcript_12348/g.20914  ORF Transcript_12348/g.20914 Transcript_12348/m.20914 type:complete len:223 (+) Transcript_12348:71-739(+)
MLRRKVETSPEETVGSSVPSSQPPRSFSGRSRGSSSGGGGRVGKSGTKLWFFLCMIVIVSVTISVMSPNTAKKAEQKAEELVHDVYKAEQEVESWIHDQQQKPPISSSEQGGGGGEGGGNGRQATVDATEAMKRQPSSWVDGEKKLKQKLKELVERQKEGKDLGAPILTRYLGEDIQAWVPKGDDEDAWTKKRDAKYDEMRKEEEQWKEKVRKYMEAHPENI